MKTITMAYYDALAAKADGKRMGKADVLISLRSAGKVDGKKVSLSHQEIIFVDRDNVSFSATTADGANGCRFKYIEYSHPHRWKFVSFVVTDEDEDWMWRTACSMADLPMTWQHYGDYNIILCPQGPNHIKYDLFGLLSFALEDSGKWYLNTIRFSCWFWTAAINPCSERVWCSEACCIVWNAGLKSRITPVEISPFKSYKRFIEIRKGNKA